VTGDDAVNPTLARVRDRGPCASKRPLALVVLTSVAMLSVGSCGATNSSAGVDESVSVNLENFKISLPAHVRAGLVRFDIHGLGPTMHEFNVASTNISSGDLPLAANGTVDDHGVHPGFTHLAEEEGIDLHEKASLTVRLPPGHYVLYCNMEGHYLAGMHAEVTVP
jgi:uncharacterized cupredoxin-like copper-binding protein